MSVSSKTEFKKNGRNFHLVMNKKSLPHIGEALKYLKNEKCTYLLCRKGLNKRGEEHAHIFVHYNGVRAITSTRLFGAHIATCRGTPAQNIAYINDHHPDLVEEFGKIPRGKENIEDTWSEFTEDLKEGKVDKYSRMYARFQHYADQRLAEVKKKTLKKYNGDLRDKNVWIFGPTGTGKSLAARFCDTEHIYPKMTNKWWDGYNGEKVVIMDDLDPQRAKMLADKIKVWSDRYPFLAEKKNSAFCVTPGYNLIITSNYSIDECFDEEDAKAIKRRFTVLKFKAGKISDETTWF